MVAAIPMRPLEASCNGSWARSSMTAHFCLVFMVLALDIVVDDLRASKKLVLLVINVR